MNDEAQQEVRFGDLFPGFDLGLGEVVLNSETLSFCIIHAGRGGGAEGGGGEINF